MNIKIETAVDRLKKAIAIFKPSKVFGLYSGGHDSRTAMEIACRVKEFSGAVHCNTGIGVEETRDFVRETCQQKGWGLQEFKATENTFADGSPDPMIYDDIVRKYGFPGPAQHRTMYIKLKERAIRRLMRAHKQHPRDRIILVSGVRSAESIRRMGTVAEVNRDGCQVWVAPVHDWEKPDIKSLFEQEGIKRNPVVDCLGMSGECLCGAYAENGELDRVATEFPYIGERLDKLHAEIKHKFPWNWDEKKPCKKKSKKQPTENAASMPMCWNCNKNPKITW